MELIERTSRVGADHEPQEKKAPEQELNMGFMAVGEYRRSQFATGSGMRRGQTKKTKLNLKMAKGGG